ncbi:peptidoglycan DD-metalloendopeptidase family protein [Sphingomonas sp. MAH-20]|uniref:Peptidoglycan DD-metalloendopeptidase family protein n=1 Tax=Sphingomonas horti TaxID=2682842 RepID=A0A6I4IXD8_9SPHN|nr:M23 family metallopeptidase [Sphingomonas sp. CGMCC 1.13658]MBA2920532.1 M23 family metallopeptidase [Sphingomonas sp. CGMCC 1.13658]MVO76784.1 peptidoglycan DD-metalloendopeptidase family protein [Sphingomonas horti]
MAGVVEDSWDPREWARSWTPSSERGRVQHGGFPPGLAGLHAGLGAAVLILLIGAAFAWFSRVPQGQPLASSSVVTPARASTGPTQVRRTLVLPQRSDLARALAVSGVPAEVAREVATAALPALAQSGDIRAVLTLTQLADGLRLDRLEASNGDSSGVVVERTHDGALSVSHVAAQLSRRIMVKHGTMDGDSFYSSAVAVGVPNSLISDFAKALAFDFNFQSEVAAGDAFEVAYAQSVNASGEAVGAPILLYASLTTESKSASVYRFAPDGGADEWFDSSGRSIVRALMRTPVDGARVTSKFGLRFHPILHFMKLHGGIDFAAPIGTPIYASGSGVIEWAAFKGANGNLVVLRHDNGWQTLYLHMNRFAPGIAPGARVSQGQQIGEIGTTGRSTGPHLHYEVHINGERVDPLGIQTEAGKTLEGAQLIAFEKLRDRIDVSRAAQTN